MIYIAMGGNLDHPEFGSPRKTLEKALEALSELGVKCLAQSPWYRTAPVPISDQPWFVNGVAEVAVPAEMDAEGLLTCLHEVEERFGRVRGERNAPRLIDLDLIDFNALVADCAKAGRKEERDSEEGDKGDESDQEARIRLPHPRMHDRAFVLLPLRDLAPDWRHPGTGQSIRELVAALPSDQKAERIKG